MQETRNREKQGGERRISRWLAGEAKNQATTSTNPHVPHQMASLWRKRTAAGSSRMSARRSAAVAVVAAKALHWPGRGRGGGAAVTLPSAVRPGEWPCTHFRDIL